MLLNTKAFATGSQPALTEKHTYGLPHKSGQTELHGEGYDARIILPRAH